MGATTRAGDVGVVAERPDADETSATHAAAARMAGGSVEGISQVVTSPGTAVVLCKRLRLPPEDLYIELGEVASICLLHWDPVYINWAVDFGLIFIKVFPSVIVWLDFVSTFVIYTI